MPIEHLYIARVIDGLILVSTNLLLYTATSVTNFLSSLSQVASMDHGTGAGNNQQMDVYKSQVWISHMFKFLGL